MNTTVDTTVMKARTAGFTLVEMIFTLLLIAILGGLGVSRFYDLGEASETKLAAAVADEAQVRINTRFTHAINTGRSCAEAVRAVNTLEALADDAKTRRFGQFVLSIGAAKTIDEAGTPVDVTSLDTKRVFPKAGILKVPSCRVLAMTEGGGLEGDGGFVENKPGQIVDEDGTCNPALFPCGLSKELYDYIKDSFLVTLGAILSVNDSLDSTYPHDEWLGPLIRDIQDEFDEDIAAQKFPGFQLTGKLWSIQITKKGLLFVKPEFRVIVSNVDISQAKPGMEVECEMYDSKTKKVYYGKTKVIEKTSLAGTTFLALDTNPNSIKPINS